MSTNNSNKRSSGVSGRRNKSTRVAVASGDLPTPGRKRTVTVNRSFTNGHHSSQRMSNEVTPVRSSNERLSNDVTPVRSSNEATPVRSSKRSRASTSSMAFTPTIDPRTVTVNTSSATTRHHSSQRMSNEVTPVRSSNERMSNDVTPVRSSKRSRASTSSTASNPITFSSDILKEEGTTCLSIGLHHDQYKGIICEGCRNFFTDKLKSVLENHNNVKRTVRQRCQRPWECADDAQNGKKHRRDGILALFVDPLDNDTITSITETPVAATAEAQSSMLSEETAAEAKSLMMSEETCSLNEPSAKAASSNNNKSKVKRGRIKLIDDNKQMNNEPTNTAIANLDGHTSLEEHDMKLVVCLEATNPNEIANAIRLLNTELDKNGH